MRFGRRARGGNQLMIRDSAGSSRTACAPPLHPTGRFLGGMREFAANQIDFLAGTGASGRTVLVRIGPRRLGGMVCVPHTAAGAEAVLAVKSAPTFRRDAVLYQEPRQVVGNGLLTAQDDDWLRAWMPFGAGPRACIGQHFAMLEAAAAVGLLARGFDIESLTPTDRVPLKPAITLSRRSRSARPCGRYDYQGASHGGCGSSFGDCCG